MDSSWQALGVESRVVGQTGRMRERASGKDRAGVQGLVSPPIVFLFVGKNENDIE